MKINIYHNITRLLLAGFFLILSCQQSPETYTLEVPAHFPELDSLPDVLTKDKVELGRSLFYEKALSLDSTISCGSCHMQSFAFADTSLRSSGVHGSFGFRNTQALSNMLYQQFFFRDGGVNTIERATIPPMQTDFEMHLNIRDLLKRLNADEDYKSRFIKVFGREADHKSVLQSLAAFQRVLTTGNSPFDDFLEGDVQALSNEALSGMELFFSDSLACDKCHHLPFFRDEKVHNIGLYIDYEDYGRGRVSLDSSDFGKFMTPTLRNIAVTAPYMHDGSLKTLEEVIDFYAGGGLAHKNKSKDIKPFILNPVEKHAIIEFLNALTDSSFLANPAFSNPL